jgi:hypothetical protein
VLEDEDQVTGFSAATLGLRRILRRKLRHSTKGFDVGLKNWRLYAVILMALLVFNTFSVLFSNTASSSGSCGSVIRPVQRNEAGGQGGMRLGDFSETHCPIATETGLIEAFAGIVLAGLLGFALILENEVSKSRLGSLPSPPSTTPTSMPGHFCEHCGGSVPVGAKFCPVCGTAQ